MLIGVAPPPNNYMVYWLIKELILEGPRLENSGWSTSVKISIDAKLHSIDFPIKRKTEDELGRFPWSKEVWKSNFRQYGNMISRGEKSQRREEKRREDKTEKKKEYQKRERLRRKKMQMREKVGKSRNTVFFQWFVAPEGRKVGSLKRRVRSLLGRWEMKNCTPLWREAPLQVKKLKTSRSDHFWKLRCRKSARRCGSKHISKSKCTKHTNSGPLLEVEMWK